MDAAENDLGALQNFRSEVKGALPIHGLRLATGIDTQMRVSPGGAPDVRHELGEPVGFAPDVLGKGDSGKSGGRRGLEHLLYRTLSVRPSRMNLKVDIQILDPKITVANEGRTTAHVYASTFRLPGSAVKW